MKNYYVYLFVLLLILISILLNYFKFLLKNKNIKQDSTDHYSDIVHNNSLLKNKNIKKHSTNEMAIGHYSDIVNNNFLLYPNLLFTSPIYFTISENESLWMPKYYWHWIKSSELTIAVNFWVLNFNNNDIKYSKPFKLNTSYQNNEIICKNILSYDRTIFFDNSKTILVENIQNINFNENNYFYTVPKFNDNYELENLNSHFHNLQKENIIIPDFLNNEDNVKPNFWFATGNQETGLHYDDYDNLLCVLKGKKTIILYPPSDSKYLYPYSILPFWAETKALDFDYNAYKYHGLVENSLPSSRLLYELILCYNNKKMLKIISDLTKKIGINKLIYGCKLKDNVFRSEIYCYYNGNNDIKNLFIHNSNEKLNTKFNLYKKENNNICIHSFDLHNNDKVIGEDIHFYHVTNVNLPFEGYTTTMNDNIVNEGNYKMDEKNNFKKNFENYMKDMKFTNYNLDFKKLLDKYDCEQIAIYNKFDNFIFIQYMNISITDFINFIKEFNYPSQFIKHVEENKLKYEKIKHEITIVYDNNCNSIRSSFYGII